MKKEDKNYQCINCETKDSLLTRGYCSKCYPLILRIEKSEKDILPDLFKNFEKEYYSLEQIKKEYIRQIKWRMEIIRDSRILKEVTPHDLEYRINGTLRMLDGKSLGKINDPIAHYLGDETARAYIHQLFSKIQLLKPFKIDYNRLYEEGRKTI